MQQVKEIDQKQIASIKGQTTRLQARVEEITIVDAESMALASELRSKIKAYDKAMSKEKKGWLDPINVLRNKVFDTFRPFEAQVAAGLKAIDAKMIAYQTKVEQEAREAEAKLQARVDKGTLKPEAAMRKMEDVATPDNSVSTAFGKTVFVNRREIEIEDVTKIPREYMVPDMVKIRQAALTEGVSIDGVKVVTRKVPSSR